MTRRKIQYWVIPPEANGEFVANMEEVLETYAQPYDKRFPVVCMDEQPVQLLKETRVPIAMTKSHPQRVDYEYERAGTASIFMFCEPLSSWREVHVRPQRTKVDWAIEVAQLLRTRYARAEKVILVCDNLNTHTKGAFYEALPPGQARDSATPDVLLHPQARELVKYRGKRIEFHDSAVLERTPYRRYQNAAARNPCLGPSQQQKTARRQLAFQNRQRPH